MRKAVLRRAIPCSIKSGSHYAVIWLAAVQYLIYLERESLYWMKHKLNSISVLFCQINQLLDKYQIKQLFYHSCPNFSHDPLRIIRNNYKQVLHAQWSLLEISQILFESEVCGVKWQHFHNKIVNNFEICQIYGAHIWPFDH